MSDNDQEQDYERLRKSAIELSEHISACKSELEKFKAMHYDAETDCAKRTKERNDWKACATMLKTGLSVFQRGNGHDVGCKFDVDGNDPDSDWCTCHRSVARAIAQFDALTNL